MTHTLIPHNRPAITNEDVATVVRVLSSGWIAQGPEVEALEGDFTRIYGSGGACACSSGTAALFLALRGLGIGPGDIVAVPSYVCSAVLNAVYLSGAAPVVVDVGEDDFTIDPLALDHLTIKPKAVIAAHIFGAAAAIPALKSRGFLVVEDCCQSLGGVQLDASLLGSQGDAAVFSFYATKIITCGHGGLVWDRTGQVAAWARDYRNFDRTEKYKPRFNFHLTDFQAALARSQLARLRDTAARRRHIARQYLAVLPDYLKVQKGVADPGRMVYRFVLRFPDEASRNSAAKYLQGRGIGAMVPIEPAETLHHYLDMAPESCPNTEKIAHTTLSLPVYPSLGDADVERVVKALSELPV